MSIVGGRGRCADLIGTAGAWGFASTELAVVLDVLEGGSSDRDVAGLIGEGTVSIIG